MTRAGTTMRGIVVVAGVLCGCAALREMAAAGGAAGRASALVSAGRLYRRGAPRARAADEGPAGAATAGSGAKEHAGSGATETLITESQELLKKNSDMIASLQKGIASHGLGTAAAPQASAKSTALPAPTTRAAKSTEAVSAPKSAAAAAPGKAGAERPASSIFEKIAPPKKLSELLFGTTERAHEGLLSQADASAMLDYLAKLRAVAQQLDQLAEAMGTVLAKFRETPGGTSDHPQEVMKYHIIEVTEKKK